LPNFKRLLNGPSLLSPFIPEHLLVYFIFSFAFLQTSSVIAVVLLNGLFAANTLKFWLRFATLYRHPHQRCSAKKVYRCSKKHNIAPTKTYPSMYRLFQVYFTRLNGCYGSFWFGCHQGLLYVCFVLIIFAVFRVPSNALMASLGICMFSVIVTMELVEGYLADSNPECKQFIQILKMERSVLSKLCRFRSRLTLPIIRMQLAGGFFYCDRAFMLTFVNSGVHHVITMLYAYRAYSLKV